MKSGHQPPAGAQFNFSEAQRGRAEEARREQARLQARAPFDRAADAAERAERELRLAFEALPGPAADIRRQLVAHAVAACGIVHALRAAAERASSEVSPP